MDALGDRQMVLPTSLTQGVAMQSGCSSSTRSRPSLLGEGIGTQSDNGLFERNSVLLDRITANGVVVRL